MIRVVIVADSGHGLAALTAAVEPLEGAYIVRHGSGQTPLDRLIAPIDPDLVVIADLQRPEHAIARLAEVRGAAPAAKVVMLSSRSDVDWLADALRAGASAVLPGSVEPHALALVLREVIAAEGKHAAPSATSELAAERPARPSGQRQRRRPRRARTTAQPVEKAA
jgi:DNA-binding NarL/FixJ family response regulator